MRRERGFILPMVIFALAVMGVLVMIIVGTSDDDRLGSRYDFEGTRSFYAAEAGANKILADWKTNGYEATVPNVGNTNVLAWATLPQGGGRYRGTILKVDANTYMITVDGQSPGARKGLRTVQVMLTPGISFNYATYGASDVKFSGGAGTDSFNSDVGGYATSNCTTAGTTCNGDIGSNATMSQLSTGAGGTQTIHGDATAYTSMSGGCTAGSNPDVTGTCSVGGSLVTLPTISCPVTGYSTLSSLPGNVSYSSGVLTINSPGWTLPAGDTWYFKTVKAQGGADWTINPAGSKVTIYIDTQLTASGGSDIVNTSSDPRLLEFIGCGATSSSWTVSGTSSTEAFAIYAPKDDITVSGGSGIYGAVVGRNITVSGGTTAIHYDDALAAVPSIVLIPGSWTEITR